MHLLVFVIMIMVIHSVVFMIRMTVCIDGPDDRIHCVVFVVQILLFVLQ